MSHGIYADVIRTKTEGIKRKTMEMTVVIYESADHMRDHDFRTETNTLQPLQHTGNDMHFFNSLHIFSHLTSCLCCSGSDSVKSWSSRAAVVCLVLLCVLLLTAVIVLTKINNLTEERNQMLTNTTNLTDERDRLLTNNSNHIQLNKQLNQVKN